MFVFKDPVVKLMINCKLPAKVSIDQVIIDVAGLQDRKIFCTHDGMISVEKHDYFLRIILLEGEMIHLAVSNEYGFKTKINRTGETLEIWNEAPTSQPYISFSKMGKKVKGDEEMMRRFRKALDIQQKHDGELKTLGDVSDDR